MECYVSTKLQSPHTSIIPGFATPLHNPFLQTNNCNKLQDFRKLSVTTASKRTYKGSSVIVAESGRQGWDFGRFLKTKYFFNGPPSPAKLISFVVEKLSGSSEKEKTMESSGIVLVIGATGGVGKRVVDILRKKGMLLRVLVVGDITKESTLVPNCFKGVNKVINAASVIVGPKEGDTPDRAKYSQGIKFFEPEIKGDSPEMVEYIGMRNLINAFKQGVGLRNGKLVFGTEDNNFRDLPWGAVDDVVMEGVSQSTFEIDTTGGENGGPTGLFKGVVSTANNGGFTSVRTKVCQVLDLIVPDLLTGTTVLIPGPRWRILPGYREEAHQRGVRQFLLPSPAPT